MPNLLILLAFAVGGLLVLLGVYIGALKARS